MRGLVPAKLADYRKVAWLGVRQPITVLPSVASLRALRGHAKTGRAAKAYFGIGNPLLEGAQDDPHHGAFYKRQADTALPSSGAPDWTCGHATDTAARPRQLPRFSVLMRSGRADAGELMRKHRCQRLPTNYAQ